MLPRIYHRALRRHSGMLFELASTLMAVAALYGVYSAIKRGYDVTTNAIKFEQIEAQLEDSMKELQGEAERLRRDAASEPDLLRAQRMRSLADEADAMRSEFRKHLDAVEDAEEKYKNGENINTVLNAFGGDTGALLAPVLDQAFQMDPPGEAAAFSVKEYFAKRLEIPVNPALERDLTLRMFQLTLERAFRECGVTSGNLATTRDCVGTELIDLNRRLATYEGRTAATEEVRQLIKQSLSNEALERLLRNRLENGGFELEAGTGADGGAAPAEDPAELPVDMDAGAASTRVEDWNGSWAGMTRTVLDIGDTHIEVPSRSSFTLKRQGDKLILIDVTGKQLPLDLSPTNPNVARGEHSASVTLGNAYVGGQGAGTMKFVIFIREDRVYFASQMPIDAEGHALNLSRRERGHQSTIAILDRMD